MSLKIFNFKYLVVNTGYTGRLVKRLPELTELLAENLEEENPIVFIEDTIWGTGLVTVSGESDEIERIRKAVPLDGNGGVIVLRCDSLSRAMGAVEVLMNRPYCAFFNFGALYQMELIDGEILVMTFDCESG